MQSKLIIEGRLPSLNELINADRGNKYGGAQLKKKTQKLITEQFETQEYNQHSKVKIHFSWYEPNTRRDVDNIASAKKFILDAMVNMKIIENDNQKHVIGFTDTFYLDKEKPRIEILIEEVS